MDDIPRTKIYRLLEMLPGLISWSVIILPFIAAFWFPRAVTIFIAVYVLAWFLRSLKSNLFLIHSFRKSRKYEKINWVYLLKFFSDDPPLVNEDEIIERHTAQQIINLKKRGLFKKRDEVYHVILMPTYKEERDLLDSSLEKLVTVNYPKDKLIFVLATEERDRERAELNAKFLENKYKKDFGQFYHFMHPANVPGELPAKGANITFAARRIAEIIEKQNIDPSNVLITTLDADNRPHANFFAVLTYHYLMEEERNKRTYQPLNFFYNNIWEVPFTNRLIALANTFWYLSESAEPHHLFNASSYTQSLDMLIKMDYWSRQTIVEDLHQFWRAYFHFKGDHEVVPLFVPVYQDALENRTYFTSLLGQYKQLRRWAWNSSDIPYVIMKIIKHRRQLPITHAMLKFIYLWFLQIMWATGPIIILLNKSIPTILNPAFANSIFVYNLGHVLDIMFSILVIGIIISLWISLLSLPRPKGKFSFLSLFLQMLLVPFVTIIYGAVPALDAQTRLLLNKPLAFVVTEKIRKIGGTA